MKSSTPVPRVNLPRITSPVPSTCRCWTTPSVSASAPCTNRCRRSKQKRSARRWCRAISPATSKPRFADKPKSVSASGVLWRGGSRSGAMGAHPAEKSASPQCSSMAAIKPIGGTWWRNSSGLPALLSIAWYAAPPAAARAVCCRHWPAKVPRCSISKHSRPSGSLLGALPEQPQPTQKSSERRLVRPRPVQPAAPVFVEIGKQKIGALRVPDALIAAMRASPCIRLESRWRRGSGF